MTKLVVLATGLLSLCSATQDSRSGRDIQAPFVDGSSFLMPGQGALLADAIGSDRSINVFAGLTRDVESVTERLRSSSANTTVLAPVNSAIAKLPHKPWEDTEDYSAFGADAYEGEGGKNRAQKNLQRFVERHVVPASPWKEGEKVATMEGKTVWFEKKDGKQLVSACGFCPIHLVLRSAHRYSLMASRSTAWQKRSRMVKYGS